MKSPPEAYLIFKEELQKQKEENRKLKEVYEQKLGDFSEELCVLREQITAQRTMLETTVEYAMRLEKELVETKKNLKAAINPNRSYH